MSAVSCYILLFAESDIDNYVRIETELLRCESWGNLWQLAANQCRGMLSLCISDAGKQLLLANSGFISYLV
eukprot:SAG11_NODE_86_length_17300_cov_11.466717_20_plen_71_part_00